jgi:transcriptional regulator with GAF, ATPase, and Fis domain
VYEGAEVAAMLEVSIYTIMRDYRLGQLAGRKVGRRILFTADSIKAFLESGRPARRKKSEALVEVEHRLPPTSREQEELLEKNRIIEAMRRAGNLRERAAKILGISSVTLRAKFKKYGLEYAKNKRH